jgi:hypothetical protein
MSAPDAARLLQQILDTHQARAWLGRLTACFFDGEAKRRLFEEMTAALPALAPPLDAVGLEKLRAGVIQELCRLASRDAPRRGP